MIYICCTSEADRIRVFVRVRPLSTEEQKKGENPGVEISSERAEVGLAFKLYFAIVYVMKICIDAGG